MKNLKELFLGKKTLKDKNKILYQWLAFKAFMTSLIFFACNLLFNVSVMANEISNSKFVKGTEKMLEDATSALIVLAPVVTIFVVGYCFIRKGAADEMDYKKWATRITTAIVCCIGVVSASIIVKVVIGYYK